MAGVSLLPSHRRAERRGRRRRIRYAVQRGLFIVLSHHTDGDTIRYSEMFPVLRALDVGAERVAEVLEEMGILVDDRRPAFESWLGRKLDGLAPGIAREVEAWQRTLHDGGPRKRARHRSTGGKYLNSIQPALAVWSRRYHHLRAVTRDDLHRHSVIRPLGPAELDGAIAAAVTPAARPARSGAIRAMHLEDVDLANRRLVIAGRVRPLPARS